MGHERAGEHDLEAALGNIGDAKLLADDFALLGDLDALADRPWGQSHERAVHGGATATTHRATAAVEKGQVEVVCLCHLGELFLGAVELPGSAQHPDILRRVRVAEHDLLAA